MTEPGEKSPLFRPEALTAGDQAWRDRPPLDLGVPTLLTSIIAVALVTALGALITLATYSSHIRMDGILLPSAGDIAISAPSSGRIEALAVREGEAIEKGAPLYTLNLDTADKDGGTPQQFMNRQTGKSEIFTHAKTAEIDALKTKTFETDKKRTGSNAHHLLELRAPEDGVITAILAYPGQAVNAGWPMLRIAPQHGPLQAELLAASNVVVFIQEGRRVRLRYSAFPYQEFGEYWGTVVGISPAPIRAQEIKGLSRVVAPQLSGPFYRIIVEPDNQEVSIYGEQHTLTAETQVHAYVSLERCHIYRWLTEPQCSIGRAKRGL